ncbi:MAG: hypothetical protein AB1610_05215 [Nitrospirota bacterium]
MWQKYIRAIYIILSAYLLMKVVIFLGRAMSKTALIPEIIDPAMKGAALRRAFENAIYIAIITICYIVIEYLHHKRIHHPHKKTSIYAYSNTEIMVFSFIYFILFSFLNFLIVVYFVSRHLLTILIFNPIFNIIPIFIIYKTLITKIESKKIHVLFLISAVLLSILMVIPYGFITDIFFKYLL